MIAVPHVDLALEIAGRFQIGYFDALILATARIVRLPTGVLDNRPATPASHSGSIMLPFA